MVYCGRLPLHDTHLLAESFARVSVLVSQPTSALADRVTTVEVRDLARLPIPDGSVDLVIDDQLDDVVEAGGQERGRGLLREYRRILRPAGRLILMGNNRYGFRRMARWLRLRPERAAGLSAPGYQRLLTDTEFTIARWIAVRESLGDLREFIILGGTVSAPPGFTLVDRLRRRLIRDRRTTNAFAMVCCPAAQTVTTGQPAWLDSLVVRVAAEIGGEVRGGTPTVQVARSHNAAVIIAMPNEWVARVPLEVSGAERVRVNFQALQALEMIRERPAGLQFPRPLLNGDHHSVVFAVESYCDGRPVSAWPRKAWPMILDNIFAMLISLHRAWQQTGSPDRLNQATWQSEVVDRLRHLHHWVRMPEQAAELQRLCQSAAAYPAPPLPLGPIHGDFHWGNVLVADDLATMTFIDWDQYRPKSLLTYDVVHFLLERRTLEFGSTNSEALMELVRRGPLPAERRCLAQFAEAFGLSGDWLRAACLAYFARKTSSGVGTVIDGDRQWIEGNALSLLGGMADSLGASPESPVR